MCSFSFAEIDPGNIEHQEELFIVCKEGLVKAAREDFHEKILIINRFILGNLILSEEIIGDLRRELRKLSDGVSVTPEEISLVLTKEVLKRDVLEGDEAVKAQTRIRRFYGKNSRRSKDITEEKPSAECQQEVKTESAPPAAEPKNTEGT